MPDFQEVYGLRLTEVALEWPPAEVVLLIAGLPARSRYASRLAGEEHGSGWDLQDWLALDTRNAVEGLRAAVISIADNKRRDVFREWTRYPGREAERRSKQRASLSRLGQLAQPVTE